MKVLFINHASDIGGAEISMANIIRYTSINNVTYSVGLPGPGVLLELLTQAGMRNVFFARMDGWRWWESGVKNRLKLLLSIPIQLINIWGWIRIIKKADSDIIHFNLTRMVEPLIAAYLLGKPTILHCREHQNNNKTFFGGIRSHARLLNLCSFWIYNSKNTAASLEPFRANFIENEIIYNGVPVKEFEFESPKKLVIGQKKKFTVLMAASLVPWKNHQDAFKVAKFIYDKISDVEFVFAGTGSTEYTIHLKEGTRKLGIENVVNFPGFVHNSIGLIQSADVVMHTSLYESFGKIFVEAMAASKPIVALRGGAAEEVIKDGITGYLFGVEELEKMANQIVLLLLDEQLRENIGEEGRRHAAKNYSMETHCERLHNVYCRLMMRHLNN